MDVDSASEITQDHKEEMESAQDETSATIFEIVSELVENVFNEIAGAAPSPDDHDDDSDDSEDYDSEESAKSESDVDSIMEERNISPEDEQIISVMVIEMVSRVDLDIASDNENGMSRDEDVRPGTQSVEELANPIVKEVDAVTIPGTSINLPPVDHVESNYIRPDIDLDHVVQHQIEAPQMPMEEVPPPVEIVNVEMEEMDHHPDPQIEQEEMQQFGDEEAAAYDVARLQAAADAQEIAMEQEVAWHEDGFNEDIERERRRLQAFGKYGSDQPEKGGRSFNGKRFWNTVHDFILRLRRLQRNFATFENKPPSSTAFKYTFFE